MKVSKQNRRDAKQLFRACVVNGVPERTRILQAVDQVLSRKPRGYGGILDHFQRLVKLDEARRAAKIESAVALTPDVEAGFRATLTRRYGAGLTFAFQPNAALIGGVRVQVGSDVFDNTVRARLNDLKESF